MYTDFVSRSLTHSLFWPRPKYALLFIIQSLQAKPHAHAICHVHDSPYYETSRLLY